MQRKKPPFRADMVGSLLRPEALKEARAKCAAGEITRGSIARHRGRRDREDPRQAGGSRPAIGHRRRVPPLVVALRFPRRARWLQARPARSRHRLPWRRDQGGDRQCRRQGWLAGAPPDDRAFQVSQGPHEAGPQDDHSEPERAALPLRLQRHQGGLSRHRPVLRRCRRRLRQGDPRLLRRRLPLSAARRHGVGLSLLEPSSSNRRPRAGTMSTGCRSATPAPSTRPWNRSRPT